MHVAALELEPKQFGELTPRLTADASFPVKALKQAADGEETCELFWVLAVGCTGLIRDRQSHFVHSVEEDADDELAPRSSSSSSAFSAAETKRQVCGQALALKPGAVCAKDDCSFAALHAGRCERRSRCKKVFCSRERVQGWPWDI